MLAIDPPLRGSEISALEQVYCVAVAVLETMGLKSSILIMSCPSAA